MKKKLLLTFIFSYSISAINSFAQCTPDGSITTPGIIASPSTVDCVTKGVPFTDNIQFVNFDSIYFNNTWIELTGLRIDSVNNLPCGLNWEMSNSNHIYQNSEPGCIALSGVTYDTIGQYKLDVWASIDLGTGFIGPLQANNFDLLTFYLRVKYANSSCPLIDTLAANTLTACNSTYGMGITISTSDDNTLCWNFQETETLTVNIANGSGHYSYQWNYADSLSCDDCPNPVFDSQVFQTGIFPVSVTVYDSISTLSETKTINLTVNICGGLSENKQQQLLVYPNPGAGDYIIELPHNSSNYLLSLRDVQGRNINYSSNSLSGNRVNLGIEDAAPGIYFLVIETNDQFYANKLIKK